MKEEEQKIFYYHTLLNELNEFDFKWLKEFVAWSEISYRPYPGDLRTYRFLQWLSKNHEFIRTSLLRSAAGMNDGKVIIESKIHNPRSVADLILSDRKISRFRKWLIRKLIPQILWELPAQKIVDLQLGTRIGKVEITLDMIGDKIDDTGRI